MLFMKDFLFDNNFKLEHRYFLMHNFLIQKIH